MAVLVNNFNNSSTMKTTLLILLASCACACARLGESNVEIMKRYGAVEQRSATGTNSWRGDYTFKEYNVVVFFRDNISECEVIRPIEERKFADAERDALMNGIAGNDQWASDKSTFSFMSAVWINKQTKAVAYVKDEILKPSVLVVSSHSHAIRLQEEQKQKEKSKAEGF
jgi:hypothetical protein